MRERRDMMRLHIQNGISDLNEIRSSYNSFADGREKSNYMSPLAPKQQQVDYSFVPGKYDANSINIKQAQSIIQPHVKKSIARDFSKITPYEAWESTTLTPWSEAKKRGLTDGTIEGNLKLKAELSLGKYNNNYEEIEDESMNTDYSSFVNQFIPPESHKHNHPDENQIYKISGGDNLSSIAKKNSIGVDDILANNKNIQDPNKVFLGQEIKLPTSKSINDYKQVKIKGDYSQISADLDFRKKTPFELDELNKKLSNEEKIKYVENGNNGTYVIEDKLKHKINVYQKGVLVKQIDSATGLNPGDRLTVTHTDENGNLLGGKGNMSTPAGMFRISSTAEYHGVPSFQRSKINEDYNIPSSVHAGNFPNDPKNRNVSNGCTRVRPKDLIELSKYVKPNTKWYILPEDGKSSEFKITGNGISFISKDPKSLFSEHARGIRKINIVPNSKDVPNNKFINTATKVLSEKKDTIIDKLGVSSDTYDKLSVYALGIAGRESGYDSPGITGSIGYMKDAIGNLFGSNMSTGAYQLRPTSVSKDISKKLFKNEKLNYSDMLDPKNSTLSVMAVLSDIYKNIAPRYKNKFKDMTLDEITIAYYANPQGIINPDKYKLRKQYAKDVISNSKNFKIEYM